VRNYLRAELSSRSDSGLVTHRKTISKAFAVERSTDQMLYVRVPGQSSTDHPWRLRSRLSCCTAPECCALMTALGIEFSAATRGFVTLNNVPKYAQEVSSIPLESLTIESARRIIEEKAIRYPNYHPSRHVVPYWFLRIHDSKWFKQKFPRTDASSIPSILDDRNEILRIQKDTSLRPSQKESKMIPLSLRARIRDPNWYRKQDGRSDSSRISNTIARMGNSLNTRVVRVGEALRRLLAEEARPRRIGRNELAAMSGLSCSQLTRVVLSCPDLRASISNVNADKNRRLLLWAARQLQTEGHPLSSKTIGKRAGLPIDRKTNALIRTIIAEFATDEPCEDYRESTVTL
jgi:hypothetical protein